MNREATIKTLKEAGRLALFAAITAVVGYLGQVLGGLDPNSGFYIVGTVALKLVDKFIHESGLDAKGVAPF